MKKLIVFSADALVAEDLDYLRTLPNFRRYLAGGAEVKRVTSVYPTITYPCHRTMVTGVYPDKHGICGNYQFLPGVHPVPWKWDYRFASAWPDDIFTEAKKAGYSTAAVFWPTTGNHPAVDCLIDEYWAQPGDDGNRSTFARMGSGEAMLDIVEKCTGGRPVHPSHPEVDRLIVGASCEIIRRFRPDLLFLHPANIDTYRHQTGVFTEKVRQGVEETDRWIGEIMDAVRDAGYADELNFVLTSDHGQLDITRVVNPNVVLADHGLIRPNPDGTLGSWDAWCFSGGLSDLVYLRDPNDRALWEKTYDLLNRMCSEGLYGFSRVFTAEEAEKEQHLNGDFSFVLETDGYTAFGDDFRRPIVSNFDTSDYRSGHATHGHLPEKGPQPAFLAKGPAFRENAVLERARLVDEAPTFAKLLGLTLRDPDGSALDSLLK